MLKSNIANIPEELTKFIREEIRKMDYELVDISTRGSRTFFLEIVIDNEGGITLDECGSFNRKITSWIDYNNIFESGYTLDVCSPGLDRILKSDMDLLWAAGKQVEIRMHEPVDSKNVIIGKLVRADDKDTLTIETVDGSTVCIDKTNVTRVKLRMKID
jgi:ribosome maturation factor RimP